MSIVITLSISTIIFLSNRLNSDKKFFTSVSMVRYLATEGKSPHGRLYLPFQIKQIKIDDIANEHKGKRYFYFI